MEVPFAELLQHKRVAVHGLVVAATKRPGYREEKLRVAGNERIPRRLASHRVGGVQEGIELNGRGIADE